MRVLLRHILVVILIAGLSGTQVLAQESFGNSFRIDYQSTDLYGGSATSSGYQSVLGGGQTVTGEATSTSFMLQMGVLYYDSFTPKSQNWRWYDDENNETPSVELAAENVAPINIENDYVIKLRLSIAEIGNYGQEGTKFRLQFSTSSDFSTGAIFVGDESTCTTIWCYADGGGVDNAIISTGLLSDSDACSGSVGDGCGTHNEAGTSTSSFSHQPNAVTEYEFTIQQSGANVNTVYFFRAFDVVASSSVPLNTGENYPSLVTGGTTLEFAIDGLSAGTTTEGETTSVATTPTSVPFGTLALNTPKAAAHRLTVTTNGTQGYKVYAYERQQLLSENGSTIDPVSGTNITPQSWASGCSSSAASCYGYHTGEDVLEGNSTRFAANDTFAQFESSPREIAFNDGPVNNKTTDIVYRIVARDLQESGSYSANIVYIVTPVF